MKHNLLFILMLVLAVSINNAYSQGVSINENGDDPDASAILDLQSSDKGLLVPRMAFHQITDIENPANGLIVFNTTDNKYYAFLEGENAWKEISYGSNNITPFVCGESLVDPRDDQSYATVLIGTQCWMGENLNHGEYYGGSQSNNGVIQKFCYQGNTANCDEYGGLYQWNEMMNWTTEEGNQGICPDGWHVPSDLETFQMENTLDPAVNNPGQIYWRGSTIGGQLKETGYTHWIGPNSGATNSSQMTLLGAGSNSGGLKVYTVLMTSTQQYPGSNYAYAREFDYNQQRSYRQAFYKANMYSVRCIKN